MIAPIRPPLIEAPQPPLRDTPLTRARRAVAMALLPPLRSRRNPHRRRSAWRWAWSMITWGALAAAVVIALTRLG